MVGSIDPRCETVRGVHWPATGRGIVWNSRRGNHLGQRPKAAASTGRTYGCKRSDQTSNLLVVRGPSTYGFRARDFVAPRNDGLAFAMLACVFREGRRAAGSSHASLRHIPSRLTEY